MKLAVIRTVVALMLFVTGVWVAATTSDPGLRVSGLVLMPVAVIALLALYPDWRVGIRRQIPTDRPDPPRAA